MVLPGTVLEPRVGRSSVYRVHEAHRDMVFVVSPIF